MKIFLFLALVVAAALPTPLGRQAVAAVTEVIRDFDPDHIRQQPDRVDVASDVQTASNEEVGRLR